jgi:hypothetical protein
VSRGQQRARVGGEEPVEIRALKILVHKVKKRPSNNIYEPKIETLPISK